MNILVINCGSSSIKFQLFDMPKEKLLFQGKAEKNESGGTRFKFSTGEKKTKSSWDGFSILENIQKMMEEIVNPENGCLSSFDDIHVVGHRLIHGGEKVPESGCVEITDELILYMEKCIPLAPLHYPANLEGIRITGRFLPNVFQAGVFDTAFHHSLPPKAFLYGISIDWYHNHQVRKYGFHGTSHKDASQRACQLLGLSIKRSRVITCHLGNGASLAAVKNGKSIDTSMGMTPVEGLLMGTRSGDIDGGVLVYLQKNFQLSPDDIQELMNKKSGLLGLSGVSADYRAVEKAAENGDKKANTALEVYYYRIKKYIGAYAAALGGIDALVFTGGVGENSVRTREKVCSGLGFLGIRISSKKNRKHNGTEASIRKKNSEVAVVIIPANEELVIAREVAELAESKK